LEGVSQPNKTNQTNLNQQIAENIE